MGYETVIIHLHSRLSDDKFYGQTDTVREVAKRITIVVTIAVFGCYSLGYEHSPYLRSFVASQATRLPRSARAAVVADDPDSAPVCLGASLV